MKTSNDYQVGGTHYNSRDYQHWDFVLDIEMNYLLACATKYVSRWKDKNGVQDLEKACHYLEKAKENKIIPTLTPWYYDKVNEFTSQLPSQEHEIIQLICSGNFDKATYFLKNLIDLTEQKIARDELILARSRDGV